MDIVEILKNASTDITIPELNDIFDEQSTVLNNGLLFIDKQKKIVDKLNTLKDKAVNAKDDPERFAEIIYDFLCEAGAGYTDFLLYLYPCYKSLSSVFGYSHNSGTLRTLKMSEVLDTTKTVDLKVLSGCLVVKLPRVPVKHFKRTTLFRDEIALRLDQLIDNHSLPMIRRKYFTIAHVFPSDTSPVSIPDNDNYDYKCIVDTIVDKLGYGDGGCDNWFQLLSIQNDNLSEGSYIIVSPLDSNLGGKFHSTDCLLEFLSGEFAN